MHQPRSYIIRIYRQGARNLTGVVEHARTGEQRQFSSMQDLWTLLRRTSPRSTPPPERDNPG